LLPVERAALQPRERERSPADMHAGSVKPVEGEDAREYSRDFDDQP
jgi:hypothetical protein